MPSISPSWACGPRSAPAPSWPQTPELRRWHWRRLLWRILSLPRLCARSGTVSGFPKTIVFMGGGVAASLCASAITPQWMAGCVPLAFFLAPARIPCVKPGCWKNWPTRDKVMPSGGHANGARLVFWQQPLGGSRIFTGQCGSLLDLVAGVVRADLLRRLCCGSSMSLPTASFRHAMPRSRARTDHCRQLHGRGLGHCVVRLWGRLCSEQRPRRAVQSVVDTRVAKPSYCACVPTSDVSATLAWRWLLQRPWLMARFSIWLLPPSLKG